MSSRSDFDERAERFAREVLAASPELRAAKYEAIRSQQVRKRLSEGGSREEAERSGHRLVASVRSAVLQLRR